MTPDEAKDKIIKLFTEIRAAGLDVLVENWLGSASLALVTPGRWDRVKLNNEDWHPEWSK